jgi:hypothetical protein
MHQKVQKKIVTSSKYEILIKKVLNNSKRTKKSPFKHFRFSRLKSPVKGLITRINPALHGETHLVKKLLKKIGFLKLSIFFFADYVIFFSITASITATDFKYYFKKTKNFIF